MSEVSAQRYSATGMWEEGECRVRATDHNKCFEAIVTKSIGRDRPLVEMEDESPDGSEGGLVRTPPLQLLPTRPGTPPRARASGADVAIEPSHLVPRRSSMTAVAPRPADACCARLTSRWCVQNYVLLPTPAICVWRPRSG
eukprot:scaffold34747_cov107-Isochrysis_galbana.AAC.4